ncbi:hypothetical protein B7R74_07175 [Yersinia pseudotuberculosis]|nr:hypothetical protein B7R74_07175 [Yersinia pseudotuberculosis]
MTYLCKLVGILLFAAFLQLEIFWIYQVKNELIINNLYIPVVLQDARVLAASRSHLDIKITYHNYLAVCLLL